MSPLTGVATTLVTGFGVDAVVIVLLDADDDTWPSVAFATTVKV